MELSGLIIKTSIVHSTKSARPLSVVKFVFLCDNGFNVRPSATNTVRGLKNVQKLKSEDSVGGTRADIKPIIPGAAIMIMVLSVFRESYRAITEIMALQFYK